MAQHTVKIKIPKRFFPGYEVPVPVEAAITIWYSPVMWDIDNITIAIALGVAPALNWAPFKLWVEELVYRALESNRPVDWRTYQTEDFENGFQDQLLNDLHGNAIANQ
jgi:hypothetical protein